MKTHLLLLLVAALVIGCGEPEGDLIFIPDPLVHVTDLTGANKKIPKAELYDSAGQPTVESVLVVDRAKNRQVYVKMDQLTANAQAVGRYILVTESPPPLPPTADSHR